VNPFAVVLDGSSYWPRKIENGFGPAGATGLGEITMIGSQEDWRKTTIGAEYRREHRKTYTRWATTVFALYDVMVSIGIIAMSTFSQSDRPAVEASLEKTAR
jgi:hypothetical protein